MVRTCADDARARAGGRILVHCVAGISRSAAVCAAYLIAREHTSLDAALRELSALRPCISPNLNFLGQLKAAERLLRTDQFAISPRPTPALARAGLDQAELVGSVTPSYETSALNSESLSTTPSTPVLPANDGNRCSATPLLSNATTCLILDDLR